jgi:arginyl-tRNA synthetase
MFKEFKDQASALIDQALQAYDISIKPSFNIPTVEKFGDLSTNLCYQLSPIFKKPPEEVANLIISRIKPSGIVGMVKAEKGYLNFYIDYFNFTKKLLSRVSPEYGRSGKKEKKIIVEHTSANPDGPLHIGHLRNAVIGDTIVRILRFAGYSTEAHYYLNDMGKQEAKVVWGMRRFGAGDGKKDHATADVYVKANKLIEEKGLEAEVSEILSQYEKGTKGAVDEFIWAVEYCLEGINETLQRLGIKHDRFVWESTFVRDGTVKKVIDELARTKHAKKDGKAIFLTLSDFGIDKEMYLTRSDGTSLYIARDLAHHAWKMRQGGGINIWGADHKLVSAQLKAGLSILGLESPEFIIHEFISLPGGSMSTRKGVFVSADNLIDETVKKTYEEVKSRRSEIDDAAAKKISEDVGVGAVRFNIARIAPEKSMIFKWEEALDFERQGAPFIQYAYARGVKILKKAEYEDVGSSIEKIADVEKKLIKTISRFPDVVEAAAQTRKASLIANYAIELSNSFHSFYVSSRVLGSAEEAFRLALVKASVTVIGSVMDLLGIKRLQEM